MPTTLLTDEQGNMPTKRKVSGERKSLLDKMLDEVFIKELKMSSPDMKARLSMAMWEKLNKQDEPGAETLLTEGGNDEAEFFKIASESSKNAGIRRPDKDKQVAKSMVNLFKKIKNMPEEQVRALWMGTE